MAANSRLIPRTPTLHRLTVRHREQVSPSMMRVTVGGDDLDLFDWRGYDHWFRLFLRLPHQNGFELPEIAGRKWWKPYLAIPEEHRPHCANYTVADFRADDRELDIDVVVHRGPDGGLEGAAAVWACTAEPGEPLAILDQGLTFTRPPDASHVLIAADESGLPATLAILRSLPSEVHCRVLQEVPTDADRRDAEIPDGVTVHWIARNDPDAVPGEAALARLRTLTPADPDEYAFLVGESTLATEGRRHLHNAGMPKKHITFSGYWKHETASVQDTTPA